MKTSKMCTRAACRGLVALLVAAFAGAAGAGAEPYRWGNGPGTAQPGTSASPAAGILPSTEPERAHLATYSPSEVIGAGHTFFGQVSGNLAGLFERLFALYGEPEGYILGQEGSGAIFGGLRYGEGVLYSRRFGTQRIYWQGPSFGWDIGADGDRVMMLVYQLPDLATLFQRFTGVNGSAYLVGGLGVTMLAADTSYIVPVRSGVGARLGFNLGYLKFTPAPTWNPF